MLLVGFAVPPKPATKSDIGTVHGGAPTPLARLVGAHAVTADRTDERTKTAQPSSLSILEVLTRFHNTTLNLHRYNSYPRYLWEHDPY